MEKICLLTFVFLSAAGTFVVNAADDAATIAFYDDQCKKIHGNTSTSKYVPNTTTNYGCKFQCKYTGSIIRLSRKSTDSLPNLSPCRSSATNACFNKKCYQKLCVDACLNATNTAPSGRNGLRKLTKIFKGRVLNRKLNYYCRTSLDLISTTTISVPQGTQCTLPGQEPVKPTPKPTAPPPPVIPGASTVTGKQGPNQVNGNPNTQNLNSTAVCLGINNNNLQYMKVYQNGCYFTCKRFSNLNGNKILQPNGLSCGTNMACLDGMCVVRSCLPVCQALNPSMTVRRIKQKSQTLKCYFVGQRTATKTPVPAGVTCTTS